MPYAFARLSLLDGRPSSSSGQPSSPTMSNLVSFVTSWLGVPPWRRTTSKASARDMQARRPVKATELLSAELSNSTGVMSPRPLPCSESLLADSLFSRPTSLCAGCRRLLFLGMDTGPKGIDQIDHPRRWGTPNRRDLFARLFLLKEVNESVFVVILEVRRIEVTRLVADDVACRRGLSKNKTPALSCATTRAGACVYLFRG